PFERLVEALDPPRSTAHTPLFQVVMTHQTDAVPTLGFDGLEVTPSAVDVEVAKFDLTVDFSERWDESGTPAGIRIHTGYATDIFDGETVEALLQRYLRVLDAAIADEAAKVGDINLLSADERAS